jgi:hypothetical protein
MTIKRLDRVADELREESAAIRAELTTASHDEMK